MLTVDRKAWQLSSVKPSAPQLGEAPSSVKPQLKFMGSQPMRPGARDQIPKCMYVLLVGRCWGSTWRGYQEAASVAKPSS